MITVKRYIVLVGESYYPAGWDDFVGAADSLDEARKLVDKKIKVDKYPDSYMELYPDSDHFNEDGWHQIIDLSDYSTISYDPSNEKLATIYISRQEKDNVS